MKENIYHDLSHGITCIDSGYIRRNLAAIYLIEHKGDVAIIESGTSHSLSRVLTVLDNMNIAPERVKYIVPTHIHLDHAGGVGSMMNAFPNAKMIVHPRGARHMVDPSFLIKAVIDVYGQEKYNALYGELTPVPDEKIVKAEDNMVFELSDRTFSIRYTPGHAEHHICIWDELSKGWFTGDTFGVSYPEMTGITKRHIIPTTTPTHFNPEKLLNSIDLLMSYKPACMYLTHFGLLENPQDYCEILSKSISEYCEIAQTSSDTTNLEEEINKKISELEYDKLLKARPDITQKESQDLLGLDIKLSAQGLCYWVNQ